MANVTIDFTGRFDAAFGFLAKNIIPRVFKVNPYGLETYQPGDPDFENVTFEYQREGEEPTTLLFSSFPFVRGGGSNIPEGLVAPPPIIEFSRDKELITTNINNSGDEVVERWNTRQYNIRMRGLLVDMDEHHYPTDLVNILHRLFEFNGVIDATGTQFYEKDIAFIYLRSFSATGVTGYPDTVQYTIESKAISEVSFTLLNPNG